MIMIKEQDISYLLTEENLLDLLNSTTECNWRWEWLGGEEYGTENLHVLLPATPASPGTFADWYTKRCHPTYRCITEAAISLLYIHHGWRRGEKERFEDAAMMWSFSTHT